MRMEWKQFVAKATGLTPKFLTRAINKRDCDDLHSRRSFATLRFPVSRKSKKIWPEKRGKMRNREQRGQIIVINGRWYVRFYERQNIGGEIQRKRITHCLGPVTTRGKRPPDEILAHRRVERAARGNGGLVGLLKRKNCEQTVADELRNLAAVACDGRGLRVKQRIEHRDHLRPVEAVGARGKAARIRRPQHGGDFLAVQRQDMAGENFWAGLGTEIGVKDVAGDAALAAQIGKQCQALRLPALLCLLLGSVGIVEHLWVVESHGSVVSGYLSVVV